MKSVAEVLERPARKGLGFGDPSQHDGCFLRIDNLFARADCQIRRLENEPSGRYLYVISIMATTY